MQYENRATQSLTTRLHRLRDSRRVVLVAFLPLLPLLALSVGAVASACSSSESRSEALPNEPAIGETDAEAVEPARPSADDAATPAPNAADASTPPLGQCASEFGNALTAGFGRIDGIVQAVQKPSDTSCTMPNSDHVIVQVKMNGAVYRMVVNVESTRANVDPKIRVASFPHALPAPAFSEGWHTDAPLDYSTTLGAHSTSGFSPMSLDEAVAEIASALEVGKAVSVYAESGAGRPESAHLVHRNKPNRDGAIVVNPTTSPRFLLFHFDGQNF